MKKLEEFNWEEDNWREELEKDLYERRKSYLKTTLVVSLVCVVTGIAGINIYYNKINPPIKHEFSSEEIKYGLEVDPYKYTPIKPISDNPHHYIPNSPSKSLILSKRK